MIGLCGGYQMLGREIRDPDRVESSEEAVQGLGLLDVTTTFTIDKQLARVRGTALLPGLEGLPVEGYEIHYGVTTRGPAARPALRLSERRRMAVREADGAVDAGGRVFGTYLHGLFDSPALRRPFLRMLGWNEGEVTASPCVFDRLADWLEAHTAMDRLLALIGA